MRDSRRPACEPRFATARSEERQSFGPAVLEAARRMGSPLMPWQQQVAMVAGELLGDGRPAFRDLIVTVPRQSGKTTLLLALMIQRARGWNGACRIVYSAQTGNDARKKLVEDWEPLLRPAAGKLGLRRVLRGMGNEAVEFRNGSRIVLLASQQDSGHGKTLDLGVEDELFADGDFRRDQALVPAMATKPNAQLLISSTAGTNESVPLNAAVKRGRQAVLDGAREGTAYFEWSKPDDADIDCEEDWWRWMPALGHTIGVAAVRHARDILASEPGEFLRAYGNISQEVEERVIPRQVWERVSREGLAVPMVEGSVVFGVDVNPERSAAAVVVADGEDGCELVEHRPGTGWLLERLVELADRWRAPVLLDPNGPARTLIADLEAREVRVTLLKSGEFPAACGSFYDEVADAKLSIRAHAAFDQAVAGAQRRQVGDAWAWARRDLSVDVSPLVALTVARWGAKHHLDVSVYDDRPVVLLG